MTVQCLDFTDSLAISFGCLVEVYFYNFIFFYTVFCMKFSMIYLFYLLAAVLVFACIVLIARLICFFRFCLI